MSSVGDLAAGLSAAFLGGAWNEAALLRRGRAALDIRVGLTAAELQGLTQSIAATRRSAERKRLRAQRQQVLSRHRAQLTDVRETLGNDPVAPAAQAEFVALRERIAQLQRAEHRLTGPDPRKVAAFAAGDIAGWLRPIVRDTLAAYHLPPRDRPRELTAWLALHPDVAHHAPLLRVIRRQPAPLAMADRQRWPVRPLADVGALASWLRLDAGELAAFADTQLRNRRSSARLQHYRVTTRVGASGSVRVLEAPKERLKTLQRLILRDILSAVPVHDAAHGFVAGRSALSAAQCHVGRPLVVLADLEAFFASVTAQRVYGIFRTAGYAEAVAHVLTGLCTTALSTAGWARIPPGRDSEAHWRLGRRLAVPHLPQGAPTSPALANLAAWSLDLRLSGLARSWKVDYTRYADDLVFSGPSFRAGQIALLTTVGDIVTEEGFALNVAKTRSRSRAQRQQVLGIVVNERPAIARPTVDELRAILHNCATHGPSTQNREGHPDFRAHLAGRISWVAQAHPTRGAQLRTALDRIDWSA